MFPERLVFLFFLRREGFYFSDFDGVMRLVSPDGWSVAASVHNLLDEAFPQVVRFWGLYYASAKLEPLEIPLDFWTPSRHQALAFQRRVAEAAGLTFEEMPLKRADHAQN